MNYDENNFVDNPGAVKRRVKHAHRILNTTKSSTSVMFAISVDRSLLPPYVVYKANICIQDGVKVIPQVEDITV